MKIYGAVAYEGIVGWNLNAFFLADEDPDTLLFSNGNSFPIYLTFYNPTNLPITYEGTKVETLELAAGEQFVGLVTNGNIVAQYGQLKSVPLIKAPELPSPAWSAVPITSFWNLTFDQLPAYTKAQRKELNKINQAVKTVRANKKLLKAQEEDL